MKLWPRARMEKAIRKLIPIAALITGALWLGGRVGFFPLTKDTVSALQGGWFALFWIDVLLRARARQLGEADPTLDEPSPAFILTILIVMTGAADVFASLKGSADASTNVPYLILVGTILLALLGYTLASRHRDRIGEARFKMPPKPD
ncbi:hypothetical protein AQZ52_10140 [Novosphingobium fuchskuhlense]|uniref:Uncharacterized protein n=1 Tax=Novosphingobium fuchskuhlense TaxID=1117702 RepID=A0A124JUB2_9SPHN|nr:hypothetical protein [Novosphingobium fuchskuhlense]KUR71045.1 hypothetical protein AQZ52_10140 [Novosphingobium fuchskuhlense]